MIIQEQFKQMSLFIIDISWIEKENKRWEHREKRSGCRNKKFNRRKWKSKNSNKTGKNKKKLITQKRK